MEAFNTSLVREKIIMLDEHGPAASEPIVIRSNRISLKLGMRAASEKIVIRAQNMHLTLRIASRLMSNYFNRGLFLDRTIPFEWDKNWKSLLTNYDVNFNQDAWSAIYINGRPVFKTVTSPFVDVIEKCALLTLDNYDATMNVTTDVLKKVGREMRIEHHSNVASVFTEHDKTLRCGIIHRTEGKDTTFNFIGEGDDRQKLIVQSLGISAAFLEALNLRFTLKSLRDKKPSKDGVDTNPAAQIRAATARMVALNKGIQDFERAFAVKYRPEKPDLFHMNS